MTIRTDPTASVALVVCDGEIDHTTYEDFRDEIVRAGQDGANTVVVDMGGVTFLNSTGLRGLIAARKTLDEAGVALQLGPLSPIVEKVLDVTGLLSRFDGHEA